MTQIEQIKAEIERNVKHYERLDRDDFKNGELYICQELLSFIESLEKEPDCLYGYSPENRFCVFCGSTLCDARKPPKIKGWVARDEDGRLTLFRVEPRRLDNGRWWDRDYHSEVIDEQESFPDLKWEDDPIEVELTINRV